MYVYCLFVIVCAGI